LNFSLLIDEKLISHDEEFRMRLKNKVVKAYIEEIDKLEKPGLL
jgi:hypothetical protein